MFHLFTCRRNAGDCVCFTCLPVVIMQVLCVFHLFTCRRNAGVVCVSPVYLSS